MSKVSNVLTMLQLLQSGRKYSISELASILEVSERMIRVYKEDLEKAGIYIDTIMGPYGGYVLNQPVRMPVRKFMMKDVNLLDKYINLEKDKDIKEKRKVKILYYSYGKGENERIIDPAEMFLFQDGWYCAAFCEKRQDIRHFELKRIIKYELLDEKYE